MAEGIRLVAIFDGLRRYGNAHAIWHTCRSCMGEVYFDADDNLRNQMSLRSRS